MALPGLKRSRNIRGLNSHKKHAMAVEEWFRTHQAGCSFGFFRDPSSGYLARRGTLILRGGLKSPKLVEAHIGKAFDVLSDRDSWALEGA